MSGSSSDVALFAKLCAAKLPLEGAWSVQLTAGRGGRTLIEKPAHIYPPTSSWIYVTKALA